MSDFAFQEETTDALPDGRDQLKLDMQFGVESVEITVDYPVGQAILALSAISQLGSGDYVNRLTYSLRNERSVRERLDAAGLAFEDEDEDDDWHAEVPD